MRILVCSKRDLSSVVILNDLLARLRSIPGTTVFLMLAERTRTVETRVAELVHMKRLERDLPFGVLFPLIEDHSLPPAARARALDEIGARHDLPLANVDRQPVPAAKRLRTLDRLIAFHAVPHLVVRRLADPDVVAAAEAFAPDLILSARFSFVFPPSFLALARYGAINVHPGRLPDYAGLYPHFYSMLAGERTLGCSVHVVDERIDTGPVLAAGETPIDRSRSAFAHNLDSHLLGNRLVAGIVEAMAGGRRPEGVAQDRSLLRQHTYPTPEEFQAFRAKHLALVDIDEYLELLWRFGLFDGVLSSPHLPRPIDYFPRVGQGNDIYQG